VPKSDEHDAENAAVTADEPKPRLLGRLFGRGGRPSEGQAVPIDGPSPVVDIDDVSFLTATAGSWTIVDFWAPWCGPCRAFHPRFDRAAREHAHDGVRFARLDVDSSPRSAAMVGIQSIPTVVLFDPEGNEARRIVGVPSTAKLHDLIHEAS